ncbi:MAG: phytoene desaturase [Myxococcales bacterium]|nr:phytoene desaturase [Myxococcales bacterium]
MGTQRALIVGGGLGGLAAAIELGRRGLEVMVLERAPKVGGKMREVVIDGRGIDSGPTVLTMRGIFDELFEAAGERLDDHLTLDPMTVLARHAWEEGGRLDLFADHERSAEAIGRFASAADARGYRRFCEHTRRIFEVVEGPFIASSRPTLGSLVAAVGWRGILGIADVDAHRTMWRALGAFFRDPRLRQLFGRYATYYGSSPFAAPATLNLIAHVEQRGVWTVRGGIYRLAEAMAGLAARQGVVIRGDAEVSRVIVEGGRARALELADGERIDGDAIVVNADVAALAGGLLGAPAARAARAPSPRRRSLSALTWSLLAEARGFPLTRHSVFFGGDYEGEFRALFDEGRLPPRPTVYVCAQDRPGDDVADADVDVDAEGRERLFVLVNAPAVGGEGRLSEGDYDACEAATFRALERAGLSLSRDPSRTRRTTPDELARRFPATGGAIYGAATHGLTATLRRPGARTRVPGLYLAGGSAHPGAGVPMVTLSGRFAASAVAEDLASTGSRRRAATPGGTSTGSATTGASASR